MAGRGVVDPKAHLLGPLEYLLTGVDEVALDRALGQSSFLRPALHGFLGDTEEFGRLEKV